MHNQASHEAEELGVFQIVILVLSVIVLGALVADTAFTPARRRLRRAPED